MTDYGAITSVVVSRAGEIVRADYVDGDADSLRNTRSCTKTVLGMLLGIAIDRGLVGGVDVPVLELLNGRRPRAHDELAKERITVRDLLTMSSCLDCNDWDEASPGNEERMYPSATGCSSRSTCRFGRARVQLLHRGCRHARRRTRTGRRRVAPTFARRELFEPLGIDRAEWQQTPDGPTSTAGGLLLTSRALLALGELYLHAGAGVVPREWVHESLLPHARIDEQTEYGYLWWLKSFAGERSFYMTGMGGNRVHVFPELELVAVITSENFARRDAHALTGCSPSQILVKAHGWSHHVMPSPICSKPHVS